MEEKYGLIFTSLSCSFLANNGVQKLRATARIHKNIVVYQEKNNDIPSTIIESK
jgi:hypothetical protein